MQRTKGFTILELLVVIAIIGILATVTIGMLADSRTKAKVAAAQSTLKSVYPLVVACMDEGSELNAMTSTAGGGTICDASSVVWPEIGGDWAYDTDPASTPDSNLFTYSASDVNGNSVTCDEANGCVVALAE